MDKHTQALLILADAIARLAVGQISAALALVAEACELIEGEPVAA
jgi:hypothetical protein